MENYKILVEVEMPEKAFIGDVLYWRGVGRTPYGVVTDPMGDEEEYHTYRNDIDAPLSGGSELFPDEAEYAGLGPDPEMKVLEMGGNIPSLRYLDLMLKQRDLIGEEVAEQYEKVRPQAVELQKEIDEWEAAVEDYFDEYKNELCVDLKRGDLVAYGTPVAISDREALSKAIEENDYQYNNIFDENVIVPVPAEAWINRNVCWNSSAIFSPRGSYLWVHLRMRDVLRRYTPRGRAIDLNDLSNNGATYILSGGAQQEELTTARRRGAPPKNRGALHVEIARRIVEGSLNYSKKDAATQLAQWWQDRGQELDRERPKVARSIEDMLTGYYQAIDIKGNSR